MADQSTFRSTTSLDGPWDFRFENEAAWRIVTVPNPWQAECADLRNAFGLGRYRRRITLPSGAGETVLRFGAASEIAVIRLDGREIGRHEGGYLPFEVVVPDDAPREALLEVDTLLPSIDQEAYPDHPFPEYPHGKQSWYGPLGGLWQSVTIETRSAQHIAHVAIVASPSDGRMRVSVELAGSGPDLAVRAAVRDAAGRTVAEGRAVASDDVPSVDLVVADPAPWSPGSPALYRLDLVLERGGVGIDGWSDAFGFRSIEARDGRLLLNGQPLYLRGALDQDYYPEGICTPPSIAFLEDQLRKAKALGLNCLRCHIKVPDPRYHEVADRLGMLVWTEIPNIAQFTEQGARRLRETFEGMLRRDGNHPSIVIWTIINEDWGTRVAENADHRAWLAETFDWIKGLDPTRLVVDNSPCVPNFHVKTDIDDYHYYRGVPERRAEWDKLTAEFAARPDWTFSPHGDGQRTRREPLIVSEFGVWGLPDPRLLCGAEGGEPWWTETGPFWGDGAAYPHGIEGRYDLLKLDRVFGSFGGFIKAVQWHQFQALKYQIESLRGHAAITGYVITELTDVHWEANGLLDLARNPRVFHDHFADINADVVLLPRLERWAFWAGEAITIEVRVASGGLHLCGGGVLAWRFEGQAGQQVVAEVMVLEISLPVNFLLLAPALSEAKRCTLTLTYTDASGQLVAKNTETVSVLPRLDAPVHSVAAVDPALRAYLADLGFTIERADAADVVVTRNLVGADVEAIRFGRRVLLLADGVSERRSTLRADEPPREPPFMPIVDARPGTPAASHHNFPFLGLSERQGTMWRGDWIGNFSWLRRHKAFAAMPGGPMLDLAFDRVAPRHVMTGFQPWEYEGRVHAAVVVGWVHKPAALIGERPFGKGKLVATTFRLTEDPPSRDPIAATLISAMVATAAA